MKCTCPTQTQYSRTQRNLYSTGSRWVDRGSHWVDWGSLWVVRGWRWVCQAFWIPTCWYRQRKRSTQREWLCAVEYRLNLNVICGSLISHTLQYCTPAMGRSKGPATRCDEIDHFAAILMVLEASQTTADYRKCLPENRSSVAIQLGAINCFYFLLRFFIAPIA